MRRGCAGHPASRVRARRVGARSDETDRIAREDSTVTSIDTRTVITAVFHHLFRYAYTPDETIELIETVLTDPPRPICEIYVWDRPCRSFRDEDGPTFPGKRAGAPRLPC